MGKIGVGCYGFSQTTFDELIKMQASPILLCDPPVEFYKELRAKLPTTPIFLRRWKDGSVQEQGIVVNPLAYAQWYANYVLDLALQLPGLTGVLSLNELPCTPDAIRHYDMFQVDFISEVQIRFGIPVVAMNYGVGNPQVGPDDPFITMKSTHMAKYIGLHLYGAPNEPIDGSSRDWFALRYRMFAKDLPANTVYLATESGSNQPWKGAIEPHEYFRQVSWLQDQMNSETTIKIAGQTLFGLWGNGQWSGFDISGTPLIDLIAQYNAGH